MSAQTGTEGSVRDGGSVSFINANGRGAQADNVPDSYGPDPDLIEEVDIPIAEVQARNTNISAGSRRTMSGRRTEKSSKSDGSPHSSGLKTRGRPIKPHETEPFLCVDTLPPDKKLTSTSNAGSASTTRPVLRKPSATAPLMVNYLSPIPMGSPSPRNRKCRSAVLVRWNNLSRSGRRTPMTSVYVSPNIEPKKVNPQLKSPFKHDVNKPQMEPARATTPSQDMKERTALATYHISRVLAQENLRDSRRPVGKLLKGKLQPLYPVKVKGPAMTKCRGIVADTTAYTASPNRTLQRRKQLVNAISSVQEYLYDRPRTVESVHRTSVASSVDDRDNFDEADFMDQDQENLIDGRSPITSPEMDEEYLVDMENRIAHIASCTPENKGSPGPVTEDLINLEPPSFSEEQRTSGMSNRSGEVTAGTMFVTEVHPDNQNNDVSVKLQGLNLNMSSSSEKYIYDGSLQKHGDSNNNALIYDDARPQTASTVNTGRNESIEVQARPHTAGEVTQRSKSPSKSVRFADDPTKSKEIKQLKNAQIIKQQRISPSPLNRKHNLTKSPDSGKIDFLKFESEKLKTKEEKKSSDKCKPVEVNGYRREDNDDDDDKGHYHGNNSSHRGYHGEGRSQGRSNSSKAQSSNSGINSSGKSGSAKESNSGASDKSDTRGQPAVLQIQTVLHGDQIHTMIGSVSPQRSRSPSPYRNQRPRSKSPLRLRNVGTLRSVNHENSVTGQLSNLAASDKHSALETDVSRLKNTWDTESEDSISKVTVRRPKVGFCIDGERNRESLFWEDSKGDEIFVGVREDREITFDEIDAELDALRENIQEQFQDDDIPEDSASTCSGMSVEEYLQCYHDNSNSQSQKDEGDLTLNLPRGQENSETDFSGLLDDYRKKCMEVSENCGEISEILVSPHKDTTEQSQKVCSRTLPQPMSKDRQWSGRSNGSERPASQSKSLVSCGDDSSHKQSIQGRKLVRRVSDGAIYSDSGCGSTERLSEISQVDSGFSDIPRLQLCSVGDPPDTGRGSMEEEFDGKTLLEIVCDELPEPECMLEKTLKNDLEEEETSVLEVVAKPKELSRPRTAKTKDVQPIAPFPPICFSINARPPQGYLYYFSYGTDMNLNRFSTYIKREVDRGLWGLLFGFSLVFNKKGSDIEAGGFPNIEFNPFCSVEGCVYKITRQEMEMLDKCVGYPEHYTHVVFPVWMSNSEEPDKYGVAQYCVPAVTYVAQDKWVAKEEKLSCDYSISQCLKSSSLLTPAYREHLVNMVSNEQTVSA